MTYNRVWAMPNKWTFQIPPIAKLIASYGGCSAGWLDPFAGETSPAEFTNDLNPARNTTHHMDALDFLLSFDGKYNGVLFDPPYSLRQVKECYESLGRDFTFEDSHDVGRWTLHKQQIAKLLPVGGFVISFGWNSQGMNKQNGFEIIDGLLVCHGGAHNDTIVTVEVKTKEC